MAQVKAFFELIKVELTPAQIESLKLVEKYRQNVDVMIQKGFFGMRNGSLTIHFDQNGAIASIVKNERVY